MHPSCRTGICFCDARRLRVRRAQRRKERVVGVSPWEIVLGFVFVLGSAFCSGTETALTALGDARARQLLESGGRQARLLAIWVHSPERVLSTLLVCNTLVNIGAGALAGDMAGDLARAP